MDTTSTSQGKFSSRGNELLSAIDAYVRDIVAKKLGKTSLSAKQIEAVSLESGAELAERLRIDWAGQHVYVPFDKQRRNAAIYAAFTGDNHHELASQFHLGVGTVYDIIKTEQQKRRMKQANLLEM